MLGAASLTTEIECPDTFTFFLLFFALTVGLDRRFFNLPAIQLDFIFFTILSKFAAFVTLNIVICGGNINFGKTWLDLFLYLCLPLTDCPLQPTDLAQRCLTCLFSSVSAYPLHCYRLSFGSVPPSQANLLSTTSNLAGTLTLTNRRHTAVFFFTWPSLFWAMMHPRF
ncbi:MAG: hypothetical protein RBT80_24280 [Candidatus Vecturithrix sp.]|nr:hypothetical protein [Candidatus Vecturithrix sp.]